MGHPALFFGKAGPLWRGDILSTFPAKRRLFAPEQEWRGVATSSSSRGFGSHSYSCSSTYRRPPSSPSRIRVAGGTRPVSSRETRKATAGF